MAAAAETDAALAWDAVRDQFRSRARSSTWAGSTWRRTRGPVREAIEVTGAAWTDPVHYLPAGRPPEAAVLRAAGAYLGANPTDIALTDSTTMGLGLLYNGLACAQTTRSLTTDTRLLRHPRGAPPTAARTGATVGTCALYRDLARVTADEIVDTLIGGGHARTRASSPSPGCTRAPA